MYIIYIYIIYIYLCNKQKTKNIILLQSDFLIKQKWTLYTKKKNTRKIYFHTKCLMV